MNDHSSPTGRKGTVAVVIPAYNHARYVAEAVASAADQGECVTEIVVVDDGSKDDTAAVVESIVEPRLRLIRQPNRGPSPARNNGWRSTRAEWLFFLDADDTLAPGALDDLLSAVAADGTLRIPYGYQNVYSKDFSGEPRFSAHLSRRTGSILGEVAAGYPGTIWVSVVPRKWVAEIGGFNEGDGIWRGEDFDYALQLALRYPFRWVDRPVVRTRMHESNRHRDFGPEASLDYIRSIRRAFRGRGSPRELWMRQRGLAYYYLEYACALREAGNAAASRRAFRDAWLAFPFRLGNLRAWLTGK